MPKLRKIPQYGWGTLKEHNRYTITNERESDYYQMKISYPVKNMYFWVSDAISKIPLAGFSIPADNLFIVPNGYMNK